MKMKREQPNKHTSPTEYKITWIGKDSVEESSSYYSGFHSSEALHFLAHTLKTKHMHTKSIRVLSVEEWDRFSKTWTERTEMAIKFCDSEEIGKSILIPDQEGEVSNG